jgi:hypothetical protein
MPNTFFITTPNSPEGHVLACAGRPLVAILMR